MREIIFGEILLFNETLDELQVLETITNQTE